MLHQTEATGASVVAAGVRLEPALLEKIDAVLEPVV